VYVRDLPAGSTECARDEHLTNGEALEFGSERPGQDEHGLRVGEWSESGIVGGAVRSAWRGIVSVNILAVVAAAVAAFLASGGWYAVFGDQLKAPTTGVEVSRPPALQAAVELLRNVVVAAVVAGLVARLELDNWTGAVPLGLALWIAFPVILLAGSVFHENVPWRLAAIHAGDWLVKLLVIAVIVGLWR
jgi:Protein of unknown function (DUF1761)